MKALLPFLVCSIPGLALADQPPLIAGTPMTSVVQGDAYSFYPTASDSDGSDLTFSIMNAPSWAKFTPSTGHLFGMPTAEQVGTYDRIRISVSDGTNTKFLPTFSVTVLAVATSSATLSWLPPTANANDTPLTDLAGYKVYWGTSAAGFTDSVTLTNAGLTSYVVENLTSGIYYFAISALNAEGEESTLSNVATRTIH